MGSSPSTNDEAYSRVPSIAAVVGSRSGERTRPTSSSAWVSPDSRHISSTSSCGSPRAAAQPADERRAVWRNPNCGASVPQLTSVRSWPPSLTPRAVSTAASRSSGHSRHTT